MTDLRVLIVADNLLARAGLAALLADQASVRVVGQVAGGETLVDDLDTYRPDALVWDFGWEPGAAHEQLSELIEELGEPMKEIVLSPWPEPEVLHHLITAQVLTRDHFGNLITNLDRGTYELWRGDTPDRDIRVMVHDTQLVGVRRSFVDVAVGHCLAYFGSGGHLEIAARNASAAELLAAGRASEVRLRKPNEGR